MIAIQTVQDIEAAVELNEPVNVVSFADFLDQVLRPTLMSGDAFLLDNPRVYKAAGLAELVEKRGTRFFFLPLYSPDFAPVELAFSKLKTSLRATQVRARKILTTALRDASD